MAAGTTEATAPKKWELWTGRVLSALPVVLMLVSGSFKLMQPAKFLEDWEGKFGYPASAAVPIGVIEIVFAVLYAIPRTSFLGAILVTGYLGGAIATHLRIGEPFFMPLLVAMVAWAGLYLRNPLLRRLVFPRGDDA